MEKLRKVFCALFGHSNVETGFFGYVYCGRCGSRVGDTLAGMYYNRESVVVGCGCDGCKINAKKLKLKDKMLLPKECRVFLKSLKS